MVEMSDDDKAEGCGYFVGNGDKPGPLWIVDATDFSKLGPANDKKSPEQAHATDAALRKASEDALVATWTNPAGRAGGSLTFSPHNQQIVGDKIYLSHYHGGVYVLDASAAFAGKRERPKELGFIVPARQADAPAARPDAADRPDRALLHGLPARPPGGLGHGRLQGLRPRRRHDRRVLLAALRRQPASAVRRQEGAAVGLQPQELEPAGQAHLPARQRERQGLQRRGGDDQAPGCGAARSASRSRAKQPASAASRPRRGRSAGRAAASRRCSSTAKGTRRWSLELRGRFPKGSYQVSLRARDGAGNRERVQTLTLRLR